MAASPLFAGFDFGTESVRVVIVDRRGATVGSAVAPFQHGQIVRGSESAARLFSQPLPPTFALQHPLDWIESAARACRSALQNGAIDPNRVHGVGVDFTSCTMLPCRGDGMPLCVAGIDGSLPSLSNQTHAWPKLWKHHGAISQTGRLNAVARQRSEKWLARYGGAIGLEWLIPKMLEVIESAPAIADAAQIWLEAGDWFIWQLIGSPWMQGDCDAMRLPRSTCHAGYKALWSPDHGYPSRDYLHAVNSTLAEAVAHKLPGRFIAPGVRAGELHTSMAERLGLPEGIAVSAAIIDAHSGVPGAGVGSAGTLVMVMGTSGCHMLLAERERLVAGVAGIVKDGILPGFVGYETGQAAMGDAFDWARRLAGHADFSALDTAAASIAPGADGVSCLDWFNGCRTPLMNAFVSGVLGGLTLAHGPAHIYRATQEASVFGLRWIVDTLRDGGVPIDAFVATGGLPHKNKLFMQIVASTLEHPVSIHQAPHGPALGAAILGALAAGTEAGGFSNVAEAVDCMAGSRSAIPPPAIVEPRDDWACDYRNYYKRYRALAQEAARSDSPLHPAAFAHSS